MNLAPPPRRIRLAALAFLGLSIAGPAIGQDQAPKTDKPANSAIDPQPRPGAWVKQHESFLERAKQGDVDLLFIGDSITQGWRGALATWNRHYGPRKATNFGIGGDRTQHLLWRLDNGEAEGIKPKLVVLMIGTNNLAHNTDDQIVEGTAAVVAKLKAKFPETKVLLLGVFPRGLDRNPAQASAAQEPRVAAINARVAKLDDGKVVKYLDIGAGFLDESGRIPKALMPDYLHLSRKGYQVWADAIEPTLWEMLDQKPE